ncbi:MAG: 16S rRNA (uracil(1498)-N(3))-methyltransferase [Deltaproteobacteria bacterium]|nr:16S rRNA (uracil(1498)-N(3))-methyltransferase [Deltaproteobacteria bacterium]
MKLRRFKIERECIRGQEAIIKDPGEIRHICKVLRLKVGDGVVLFDGEGKEYQATIASFSPREISLALLEQLPPDTTESPLRVILGLGILKSSKFDWLIQKATELGVSEIVPFYSSRVIPRWEEKRIQLRQSRWQKIASEAAKQCGRTKVLIVHSPRSFQEALAMEFEGAIKIFLWEREKTRSLKDALRQPVSGVYALVGPEGGFSEQEALEAQEGGFLPVRLGPRILRAETAGLVISSLLQFILGDLS